MLILESHFEHRRSQAKPRVGYKPTRMLGKGFKVFDLPLKSFPKFMNFSRLMWNILSHPDDSLYRTEVRISLENESLLFEHNLFLQLTSLQKECRTRRTKNIIFWNIFHVVCTSRILISTKTLIRSGKVSAMRKDKSSIVFKLFQASLSPMPSFLQQIKSTSLIIKRKCPYDSWIPVEISRKSKFS